MAMKAQASTVRITREAKLARAGAAMAIQIAKMEGDPLYDKYDMVHKKYVELKEKLIMKYRAKAKRKLGVNF